MNRQNTYQSDAGSVARGQSGFMRPGISLIAAPALLVLALTDNMPFLHRSALAYVPCMLVSVASIVRSFRLAKLQDRAAQGRCPGCGYNLRASIDRCPECGLATNPGPVSG